MSEVQTYPLLLRMRWVLRFKGVNVKDSGSPTTMDMPVCCSAEAGGICIYVHTY